MSALAVYIADDKKQGFDVFQIFAGRMMRHKRHKSAVDVLIDLLQQLRVQFKIRIDDFLKKLEAGMQQFESLDAKTGCELVLHIETESSYEHGLALTKYKLSYSQELLSWLKQDMGASKIWVSAKPRR